MKNFRHNFLTAVTILSLGFLFSCGEDDTPIADAPGVTVSAAIVDGDALVSGGEVVAGSAVEFSISVTAPGGFNNVDITGSTTQNINRNDLNLDLGATSASTTLTVSTAETDAGGTASFTFVAVDELNQSSEEVVFTFDIVAPPSPDVQSFTTVLLGAQGNSSEGFYDAKLNARYGFAAARDASGTSGSPVDFAYYWGASNNSTIASIDDAGLHTVYNAVNLPIEGIFGTRNSTLFSDTDLTAAAFTAIASNDDLSTAAFFEVGGESSSTNLVLDQVFAFQLDADRGGEFGLIHISSVDDTNGNGTITINVKVPGAE